MFLIFEVQYVETDEQKRDFEIGTKLNYYENLDLKIAVFVKCCYA